MTKKRRKRITDVNFQWIEERYQGLQASHDRLSGMLEKEKSLIVNNLFLRLLSVISGNRSKSN